MAYNMGGGVSQIGQELLKRDTFLSSNDRETFIKAFDRIGTGATPQVVDMIKQNYPDVPDRQINEFMMYFHEPSARRAAYPNLNFTVEKDDNMAYNMGGNVMPMGYNMGGNVMPMAYATGGNVAVEDFERKNGFIEGPGTETSDDVPAMLSDGEFVMTGSAVRGAGGFQMKNNGGIVTLTPTGEEDRKKGTDLMYEMMGLFENYGTI